MHIVSIFLDPMMIPGDKVFIDCILRKIASSSILILLDLSGILEKLTVTGVTQDQR